MEEKGKKRSVLKILLISVAAFISLSLLTLLATPTLLSTSFGKKIFIGIVEKRAKIKLEIDHLSLSWWGGQSLQRIQAEKPEDQILFTCEEIKTDASLWRIALNKEVGELQIKGGKLTLHPSGIDPIVFDQITSSLQQTQKEKIAFAANCIILQTEDQGEIHLEGSAADLNTPTPALSVQSTVSKLPMRGVEQLTTLFYPTLDGWLSKLIGNTVDLTCHLEASKEHIDLNLEAASPQLSAQITAQSPQGEGIEKAAFSGVVTALTPISFTLQGEAVSIDQLSFKASASSLETGIDMTGSAAVKNGKETGSFVLDGRFSLLKQETLTGNLSLVLSSQLINPFLANMQIELLTEKPIQLELKDLHLPLQDLKMTEGVIVLQTSPLSWGEGKRTSEIQSTLTCKTLDQLSLQVEAAPFTATLLGALHLNPLEFVMGEPFKLQGTLLPEWLPSFALTQPAPFLFTIEPMPLKMMDASLVTIKAKGQLSLQQLVGKQIILQNIVMPLSWDGKANKGNLQLRAQVKKPSDTALGQIQADCSLSHLTLEPAVDLTPAILQATVNLQNIPSTFVETLLGSSLYTPLIGPSFSGTLTLNSTPSKQTIDLQAASPLLSIDSGFTLEKGVIQLKKTESDASFTLTPESYPALDRLLTNNTQGAIPFSLKERSVFTLKLTNIELPVTLQEGKEGFTARFPSFSSDFSNLQISLHGTNPKLSFYEQNSQESIELSSLFFSLNKSPSEPLTTTLQCNLLTQSKTASTKNGSLSLTATLNSPFQMESITGGLELKAQGLPSRALDLFARAKGRTDFPFTALFGPVINADASCHLKNWSGPLSINLNTPVTRFSLNGTLAAGALLLTDPIYAQMRITPEMSHLFLQELNLLNLSSIYSQNPITLEIPSDGFYLPIYPSNVGKMAIPKATLELGKVYCHNEGNINIALSLLKAKQFDKNQDLALWFAPLDFSIQRGILNIERTEILLADTFDICFWGDVDLLQEKVDMTLGLTAQSLNKAFGIKGLPEKYVLTIPMKGPVDNVQINTTKATAKVALLLAWQEKTIAGAIGGGPAGAIVGGLLGKLATLPDSDAKVPPAKRPFPWEAAKPAKKTSSAEKGKHFKQKEKPLKQILKVIK